MNKTSLAFRAVAIGLLSIACTLPASAQSSGQAGSNSGPSVRTSSTENHDGDRDYGWLGLLGLAGLLGLRRKPQADSDRIRPTTSANSTNR